MSAARAVLSAEWRAVRQEAIALSVAIVALPLLTRVIAPGAANEGAAWLVGVLAALLAALVLGAGLFAGEAAPAFRTARPMGPMSSALVRLFVRSIVLLAILALGTVVLVAWHPTIHGGAGAAVGVSLIAEWDLVRLLDADARLRAESDPGRALRDVLALRALALSVSAVEALNGVNMLAREASVARRIRADVAPPDWDAVRRSFDAGMAREVARRINALEAASVIDEDDPLAWRVAHWPRPWRPIGRWSLARAVEAEAARERWTTNCESLAAAEPWRPSYGHFQFAAWEGPFVRARLEWELTTLAARVRTERAAGRPVSAEMLRSTTCPGESWVYAETESGWRLSVWPLPWREQWAPLTHEELAP